MISMVSVGIIIGMLYQALLLYMTASTDDEILMKIIVSINAISFILFMLIALKGYVS